MPLHRSFILPVLALILFLGACQKNEQTVAPTNDNEAITTVTLSLTNITNTTDVATATVDNLNTNADFSQATLNLKASTPYRGSITLLDKTKTPVLDVTALIRQKANEHLFVYTPASGLNLTVTRTDQDTNPAPGPYEIGLTTQITTAAASSGRLGIVLKHQPNAKNGTATPGTSDLDTYVNVVIK